MNINLILKNIFPRIVKTIIRERISKLNLYVINIRLI